MILQVRSEDYDASTSLTDQLAQSVVNGLRLGLLLAMAALGLSLIYGTTGLSNFAHAELVTLGGVLGYGFIRVMGLPLVLGGIVVVICCGLVGWLQDRVMWQPLRRRGLGLTQMMIVTIGLALALQYTYQYFIGAGTVKVELGTGEVATIGPITISYRSLIAMGISIVMIAAVGYALLRTRIGRATRAVSDNPALASASGIDVDRVIRLVWTVAAALAGLSGPALRPGDQQRHPVGHRSADPAAALRRGDPGWAGDGVRRPARLAHHRARGGAGGTPRGPGRPEVRRGAGTDDPAADRQTTGSARASGTSGLRRPPT